MVSMDSNHTFGSFFWISGTFYNPYVKIIFHNFFNQKINELWYLLIYGNTPPVAFQFGFRRLSPFG